MIMMMRKANKSPLLLTIIHTVLFNFASSAAGIVLAHRKHSKNININQINSWLPIPQEGHFSPFILSVSPMFLPTVVLKWQQSTHACLVVVQSPSRAQLLVTTWTVACDLPCPSLSPVVCSNSCPSRRWCYLTISASAAPSPFALHVSQHQSLFQWVGSSHQVAKVLELQLQHQSFQWIFRTDFL